MPNDEQHGGGSAVREDDKFMRGLIKALITVVVVQGISFVYLVGTISAQVAVNTADIRDLKQMHSTLISIEAQVKMMSAQLNGVTSSLTSIGYEQQRRTPIVNRAEDYLNRRDK